MYTYMYMYTYIHIYIYIDIDRSILKPLTWAMGLSSSRRHLQRFALARRSPRVYTSKPFRSQ